MVRQVLAHPKVEQVFSKLLAKEKARIRAVLDRIASDPFNPRPGADIKRLKGTRGRQDLFRVRIGEFRAIYAVDASSILVTDLFRRGAEYDL